MNKRTIYNLSTFCPNLYVQAFGYENLKESAKWGPGSRNFYILQFVTKGKGFFNGKLVKENQGFLIKPNALQHYYPDEEDPWEYFWINFEGADVIDLLKSVDLLKDENNIFEYGFKPWLENFMQYVVFEEDRIISNNFGNGCFYLIISQMLKSIKPHKGEDVQAQHVELALRYMKSNYHHNVHPSDVASFVGIDRRYLSFLMKQRVGTSPQEYLNSLRISKAKDLLETTDFYVSEIASTTGYQDPLHFSRFFKIQTGYSPKQYREIHKKTDDKNKNPNKS